VRARSYDIPGVIVDGQDALAIYATVSSAVTRARAGEGPTLIEAKTYRFCEHVEGYPLPAYRSQSEVEEWRRRDPIDILSSRLRDDRRLPQHDQLRIRSEVEAEVAAALEFAES